MTGSHRRRALNRQGPRPLAHRTRVNVADSVHSPTTETWEHAKRRPPPNHTAHRSRAYARHARLGAGWLTGPQMVTRSVAGSSDLRLNDDDPPDPAQPSEERSPVSGTAMAINQKSTHFAKKKADFVSIFAHRLW